MSIKTPALKASPSASCRHLARLCLVLAGALFGAQTMPARAQCTQSAQNGCVELSASPAQDTIAVPPNIMFILDDSGSMLWNYMPDWAYLASTSDNGLINANNNGAYYSPTTTYVPPPKADGSSYPAQTSLSSVRIDGFGMRSTSTTNIYTYAKGTSNTTESYECGGSVCNGNNVPYNTSKSYTDTVRAKKSYYKIKITQSACNNDFTSMNGIDNTLGWTQTSGSGASAKGTCTFDYWEYSTTTSTYSYFQYSTGPAAGPYVVYYIASDAQGCHSSETRCVVESDTSGAAAPAGIKAGVNIGNWFAYYHTRFLMAKSGVMTAFSGLSKNYRFGYGKINAPGSYVGVEPYGDGSSGTTKASFWNWLAPVSNGGSTPLRKALEAAGKYYETDEPWTTKDGDPNYVAGGDNSGELSCRSSYTILTTDGFWNGGNPNSTVAGAASSDGTEYTSVDGVTKVKYKAVAPFSGGGVSGTASLADVAAYYWKTDLRTATNLVPASKRDPAFWQHMTTYTMGFGWDPVGISPASATMDQIFTWATDGGGSVSSAISGFSWPSPTASNKYKIADLAHAAVTGHGDFFSAKNPQEMASGFSRAIAQIAERNVAPQPRASNASVAVTGALSFDTGYNTGNWSGTLEAVEMKADGTRGTVKWDLASKLNSLAASARNIFTGTYSSLDCTAPLSPKNGVWAGGKVFNSSVYSSLDCWQKLGMNRPALLGGNDTTANRIDYLRGDATYEARNSGGVYRNRTTKLGAIIRSQPVYVSYPSEGYYDNWPVGSPEELAANGNNGYSKFVVDKANREGTVYIGANDGMLHAFSAPAPACDYSDPANPTCTFSTAGGNERFAYVPRGTYANLGNLTDANFVYRPTVDATPRVRDVFINSKWTTLLTGGLGIGGRGVFALDVTDPTSFSASKVLWEFDSDMKVSTGCVSNSGSCLSSDLGYTTSTPYIGRLKNGKWVVLVSSGYFPDCTMPDVPTNEPEFGAKPLCEAIANQAPKDGSGKPYSALFVLDAQTGAMIAEIKTPTNLSGVSSHGLGPVVLGDYESDQIDDVAFAGDLMGNLWRFDLTDASPSNWKVTLAYQGITGAGGKQGVQPITSQPRLFPDPWSSRFMVVFGTGKYLGAGDNSTTIPVQAAYGIREMIDANGIPQTVTFNQLKKQTLTETSGSGALANAKVRKLTNDVLGASDKGWHINFDIAAAKGERVVVTPGAIFPTNGAVFTTMIPTKDNYCDPSTKGAVMLVNSGNGGAGGGVSSLGGGAIVGARVTSVATSGSTPLVSKLGGGGIIMPMNIDLGGAGADGSTPPSIPIELNAPVWRRRSWVELGHD